MSWSFSCRHLDPQNIPKPPSQEVFGYLGNNGLPKLFRNHTWYWYSTVICPRFIHCVYIYIYTYLNTYYIHIFKYSPPKLCVKTYTPPEDERLEPESQTPLEFRKNHLDHWLFGSMLIFDRHMDASKNRGTPQWMVKIIENPVNA